MSARNAAGPTTSSPSDCGDPSRPAPYAPSSVLRFQVRYRVTKVVRNASRADAASGWASETAVVSSITPSAVSSRRAPRGRPSRPVIRSPYSAFLLPSRIAPATPPIRLPPPATTPARANCEAPVKASRLSTQAWATLSPEPAAAAPNASPEAPTASPRATPSRTGRGPRGLLVTLAG